MVDKGSQGSLSAIARLIAARDDLLRELADLETVPVDEQIVVARQLENFHNAWISVELSVMAALDRADAATVLCQGNLRRVLTSALGISKAEAARRTTAYEQMGPRRSMLGEKLGPVRPSLAHAAVSGEVSAEKAAIIMRGLKAVDHPGFDPEDIVAGEKLLADDAKVFSPEDLKILTQRVIDQIAPDGSRPDEQLQRSRRWFEMRPTADGGFVGEFRLTAACGAKLATLLRPLSKSRVDQPCAGGETESMGNRSRLVDERTFGQRQHDAFEQCCDRLLREGGVRENNAPVTVIVTVDEKDLLRRSGHATTTTGISLSTATLLEMADEAEIYRAVLDGSEVPLSLQRSKRCATRHQSMALIARDIGCSFPGCAHPADYCERHHVVPWIDGGPTDLDNLTLLCIYHHHNFLQRGWVVRMNESRLPEWLPPRWVDPEQTPLINRRIRAAHGLP